MAKKPARKPTKKQRRDAVAAWRDCGKTMGEANLLVDAGEKAPSLKDRQRASQSVLDA